MNEGKNKEIFQWYYFWTRSAMKYVRQRVSKKALITKKYAGKELLDIVQCHQWIADRIINNIPTAVSRFGATEMMILRKSEYKNLFEKNPRNFDAAMKQMKMYSGFFPEDHQAICKFYELMISLLPNIDLLGEWNLPMEEYFISKYMKRTQLTWLGHLEPWATNKPWSGALEGKRVVIVHPFADTIREQYARRQLIWNQKNILPDFELRVVKAVQTIAGERDERFEDWFDALEYMYLEIIKEEFDVAIIGCGAYGMPLALKIKRHGKIAIHLGGDTQLMFGIRGKRWEGFPYYNEYWVAPSENEKPKNALLVENACYW